MHKLIIMRKLDAEDIACLLTIIIGGIIAITNPEKINEAFQGTILSIILIKIFW